MVAYNFKSQFAPKVQSGEKLHTIRGIGKRQHAKPGDALQLYTGRRKLLDMVCTEVLLVWMWIDYDNLASHRAAGHKATDDEFFKLELGGYILNDTELGKLAIADGFSSADEFKAFFSDRLPFEGVLIKWEPPTAGANTP